MVKSTSLCALSGVQVEVWADMGTVIATVNAKTNRFIRRVLSSKPSDKAPAAGHCPRCAFDGGEASI
jgi:hypothetical protein